MVRRWAKRKSDGSTKRFDRRWGLLWILLALSAGFLLGLLIPESWLQRLSGLNL